MCKTTKPCNGCKMAPAWMKSPFWDEEFEKLSNDPRWCPLKDEAIDAFLVELKCRITAREKEAGSEEKYYSCVFCTWKGPESETRQDVQCPNCNHLESLMPVESGYKTAFEEDKSFDLAAMLLANSDIGFLAGGEFVRYESDILADELRKKLKELGLKLVADS